MILNTINIAKNKYATNDIKTVCLLVLGSDSMDEKSPAITRNKCNIKAFLWYSPQTEPCIIIDNVRKKFQIVLDTEKIYVNNVIITNRIKPDITPKNFKSVGIS